MSINNIVTVSVVNTTPQVTQAGFGTPLILGFHTRFLERFREYADVAAMEADGFVSTDAEHKAASAVFQQNPRPVSVIVGRRLNAPTQLVELTPTNLTVGYTYDINIDGNTATYTVQPADTAFEIVAGLVTAANLLPIVMTASPLAAPDRMLLTADAAGTLSDIDMPLDGSVRSEDTTADAGIASDISDILALNSDWYGLLLTSKGKAEATIASGSAATAKKLFVVSSADYEMTDSGVTTDLASAVQPDAYTATMWHHAPHTYPEAAWMGKIFPENPGSVTWMFKTLNGIAPSPIGVLSTSQQTALENKFSNFYINCAGVSHTRFGRMANGEWIDIRRGLDWLEARIQERVFGLLTSVKKVSYTEVGVGLIKKEIQAQLQEGANRGLLVEDSILVTFPPVSSISAADKGARCLPDGKFSAQLQGAIHKTVLRGEVFV